MCISFLEFQALNSVTTSYHDFPLGLPTFVIPDSKRYIISSLPIALETSKSLHILFWNFGFSYSFFKAHLPLLPEVLLQYVADLPACLSPMAFGCCLCFHFLFNFSPPGLPAWIFSFKL